MAIGPATAVHVSCGRNLPSGILEDVSKTNLQQIYRQWNLCFRENLSTFNKQPTRVLSNPPLMVQCIGMLLLLGERQTPRRETTFRWMCLCFTASSRGDGFPQASHGEKAVYFRTPLADTTVCARPWLNKFQTSPKKKKCQHPNKPGSPPKQRAAKISETIANLEAD